MNAFGDSYESLLSRWDVRIDRPMVGHPRGTTQVVACGTGPAVVLLAGHGAISAVWFAIARDLSQGRRLYAVDLLGDAGPSRLTGPAPRTPSDLVTWLDAVLDGLGLATASLVGHSYGAWLAATYAAERPDRVQGLSLLDPTDCFTGLKPRYVVRALPMLVRPTPARTASFLRWETAGVDLDPHWLRLAALASTEPTGRPVRPRRPRLEALRTDLQVVVAGRSRCHDVGTVAERAAAVGAQVARVPAATHHSLPLAHPELTAALAGFLPG